MLPTISVLGDDDVEGGILSYGLVQISNLTTSN